MAKSKAVSKRETTLVKKVKPAEAPLTTKVQNGSPYQLDPAQLERAATALIKNMKQHAQIKAEETGKKNLLEAEEDAPEQGDAAIFLTLSTKQHIKESSRLKPSKIVLPHPIQSSDVRICLMTADPQRKFKDIVADEAFPEDLRAKIGRVVDLGKLKKKYKSFESKRQLLAEYDLFLADDRIVSDLPQVLGKVFHSAKNKRPIPVSLTQQLPKDNDGKRPRVVRSPEGLAKEIESALKATYVHLSPSATTSIRIGRLAQDPKHISENIEAVVSKLVEKFIPRGWRNIRGLHIKGPTTVALPVWLADELWADEEQVLEEPWKPKIREGESKTSEKKRKWEEWENDVLDEETIAERRAMLKEKKQKSMEESAEAKEKRTISKERRKKLKREALESVQTPLIAS